MRKPVVITTPMPTIEQVARTYGLTATDMQRLREFWYERGYLSSPDDPAGKRTKTRVPRGATKPRKKQE
jgi:hypothetical protein